MISLTFVSSFVIFAALLAAGGLTNSLVAPVAGNVLGSMVAAGRLSLWLLVWCRPPSLLRRLLRGSWYASWPSPTAGAPPS